jgi:cyclopropane-fatty-acyl-phospholipid synthase
MPSLAQELLPKQAPERSRRPAAAPGWWDRRFRSLVEGQLAGLRRGRVTLRDGAAERTFGVAANDGELHAAITVRDPGFYADLALGGGLGAGEGYIAGHWDCDDLTALIRIMARNDDAATGFERGLARLAAPARAAGAWLRRNSRAGSRRNIAAHYDLGNEFFGLMLDDTMMYSCGIFETPAATLREASVAKLDRICRKLDLQPGDRVVEIGTGWGGFALHAAGEYGCRIVTTTISKEQAGLARQRIAAAGLADRVQVVLEDYRDLRGQFDKLVSIEMVEAIGWRQYPRYFRKISELLAPDGLALVQAITMADRYYDTARRSVDFIKKFVFPGSCIPSIGSLQAAANRTDLTLRHLEDIGPHYAPTLAAWRRNVHAERDRVLALGYPPEFLRLWDYYLHYCEGGFLERCIGDVQLLFAKPDCRRTPLLGRI